MSNARIYTWLDAPIEDALNKRAKADDRSACWVIRKAIELHADSRGLISTPPALPATRTKFFIRASDDLSATVKETAVRLGWYEWQVIYSCLQTFLKSS